MKNIEIFLANNKRIAVVDYLKGFSIFTIALMHLICMMSRIPEVVGKLSAIGGTGVHVFFLCSGFGLYLSYLNKKTTYLEFIKKRFMKIYIPYIIIVFVSFFVPWMYLGDDKIVALLSHIFLYKMFIPKYESSFGLQFWFISTIIQFYLVFIPMCKLKHRLKKNSIFIALFMIVSIGWWILCYILGVTESRVWNSFLLQYIWEFSIGMVLADLLYNGKTFKINSIILLILSILGIGVQALMAMKAETIKVFNDIPALVGYTSLALVLMFIPAIKRFAEWLSKISYEYYLIHILVFVSVFYLFRADSLVIQAILGIVGITIAIIIAYYYHILVYRVTNSLGEILDVRHC